VHRLRSNLVPVLPSTMHRCGTNADSAVLLAVAVAVVVVGALAPGAGAANHNVEHLEPSEYAYREHSLQKPFLCKCSSDVHSLCPATDPSRALTTAIVVTCLCAGPVPHGARRWRWRWCSGICVRPALALEIADTTDTYVCVCVDLYVFTCTHKLCVCACICARLRALCVCCNDRSCRCSHATLGFLWQRGRVRRFCSPNP